MSLAGKRVLLIVTGGIAAFKALELIRLLRKGGCGVTCVLTKGGAQFVTPLSLQALSEHHVYTDLFSLTDESEMGHIQLSRSADLVVVHQVLHYLGDPAAAVREAARLVGQGGRLLIVDFAPHALEFLREQHQHRRLGFTDAEMGRWLEETGLSQVRTDALPSARRDGLTVKIWTAERGQLSKGSRV